MAGVPAMQTRQKNAIIGIYMVSIGSISSSHTALITGAAVFVVSWAVLLIVTPIVITSLPEDYFSNPQYLEVESVFAAGIPPARRALLFLKNVLAWFLILVAPIIFLSIFAPFFGFLLADFPAKPRLIRKFASYPFIWRQLNGVRQRRNLPPFTEPETRNQEL